VGLRQQKYLQHFICPFVRDIVIEKNSKIVTHAFPRLCTKSKLKIIYKNLQHFSPTHSYLNVNVLVKFIYIMQVLLHVQALVLCKRPEGHYIHIGAPIYLLILL
jgi:hypothetical protein